MSAAETAQPLGDLAFCTDILRLVEVAGSELLGQIACGDELIVGVVCVLVVAAVAE